MNLSRPESDENVREGEAGTALSGWRRPAGRRECFGPDLEMQSVSNA